MAPDPAILKRQRSRPSEWWAAATTDSTPLPTAPQQQQTQQQDATTKRKKGRPSGLANAGKLNARNRGKPSTATDGNETSLRRGSSSGGDAELRNLDAGFNAARAATKGKGKGRTAPTESAPNMKALRRGRPSGGVAPLEVTGESMKTAGDGSKGQAQGSKSQKRDKVSAAQVDELAEDPVARKRRGRPAATAREEAQVEEPDELAEEEDEGPIVPRRRNRPTEDHIEEQHDEKPRPETTTKKRGRPAATRAEGQVGGLVNRDLRQEIVPKKRSGLSSHGEANHEDVLPKASKKRERPPAVKATLTVAAEEPPKRNRKRLSDVELLEQHLSHFADTITPTRGRTRTRPSDAGGQEPSQSKDHERGRTWTRQSDFQALVNHAPPSKIGPENKGRRKTRRSDAQIEKEVSQPPVKTSNRVGSSNHPEVTEVEAVSCKLSKSRGDRRPKPSAGVASTAVSKTAVKAARTKSAPQASSRSKKTTQSSDGSATQRTISAPSQSQKESTNRTSHIQDPTRKRTRMDNTQSEPLKKQRVEKTPDQDRDDGHEAGLPAYQHLKAVTRKVSRQTIENKWDALPPNCVNRIHNLLSDIQRPVVVRLHDEKKRTQASTAIHMVSNRLLKKISRGLPFPPGSRNHREDDFDFEKILDHNRALEAQLTPVLHSNKLLEAEILKEMAWLEAEKEKLAELEMNAKREAASRNRAARKSHTILQSEEPATGIDMLKDDIGLDLSRRRCQLLDIGIPGDEHLQALVQELNGHVYTIQGNIKQIEGISQALAKSRAAVQATLFHHLDNTQYDEVVLGLE